jgi:cell division topological specificity factor
MPFLQQCSMLTELLERIFSRHKQENSRASAKRRLQIVLAHDRTELSPAIVEKMRQEILEVVSRYVEIDPEESEFSLESDQRMTALIANLPIRKVKDSKTEGGVDSATLPPPVIPNEVSPGEVLELSAEITELPTAEFEVATQNPEPSERTVIVTKDIVTQDLSSEAKQPLQEKNGEAKPTPANDEM